MELDDEIRAALQRRHRFRLPSGVEVVDLSSSLDHSFMMSLDGRIFESDMNTDEREVFDPIAIRLALVGGSKNVPELARLIPARTARATDCTGCEGTGRTRLGAQLSWICQTCGGVGWVENAIEQADEAHKARDG